MRKPADSLRTELETKIKKLITKPEERQRISRESHKTFDIPIGMISDYMSLRTSLDTANDFVLFVLTTYIDHDLLNTYYTEKEIKTYSESKFEVETIKFPLRFPMIEITEDSQWIGRITVKELMNLSNAQLIVYNENTQRTMKHQISGGQEYYSIYLNNAAVDSIINSFSAGLYISNTITLNLPENADYTYNKKTRELIINSTDSFDILDGYHRFVAMTKLSLINPEFDYVMELRILKFEEAEANQFIWQEDQKTPMRKIDSEYRNQYDPSTKVVQYLSKKSILAGQIAINGGLVDSAQLAKAIRVSYFRDNKKNANISKRILEVQKELKEKIDACIEQDPSLLNKPWTNSFTFDFVLSCSAKDTSDDILDGVLVLETHQKDFKRSQLERMMAYAKAMELLQTTKGAES